MTEKEQAAIVFKIAELDAKSYRAEILKLSKDTAETEMFLNLFENAIKEKFIAAQFVLNNV